MRTVKQILGGVPIAQVQQEIEPPTIEIPDTCACGWELCTVYAITPSQIGQEVIVACGYCHIPHRMKVQNPGY